jgi:hypothetical protein
VITTTPANHFITLETAPPSIKPTKQKTPWMAFSKPQTHSSIYLQSQKPLPSSGEINESHSKCASQASIYNSNSNNSNNTTINNLWIKKKKTAQAKGIISLKNAIKEIELHPRPPTR